MGTLIGSLLGILRTVIAVVWTLLACTVALVLLLYGRKVSSWVLTRIAGGFWSRPMLKFLCPKFDIVPPPNGNWPERAIYIANHSSQLDVNAVFGSIPHPVIFLSKASIKKVPFLGWANSRVGTVFVDRGNLESAMKAAVDLQAALEEGKVVVVFPEGTRSADGKLAAFKKGAFRLATDTGVPVVPMWIEGAHEALAKGSFIIRRHPIQVRFGAPIASKGMNGDMLPIDQLMHEARLAMIELSGN